MVSWLQKICCYSRPQRGDLVSKTLAESETGSLGILLVEFCDSPEDHNAGTVSESTSQDLGHMVEHNGDLWRMYPIPFQ